MPVRRRPTVPVRRLPTVPVWWWPTVPVQRRSTVPMWLRPTAKLVIPVFRNLFFEPKKAFLTGFLRFFLLRFPEEFFTGTWFWWGAKLFLFFPILQEFFAGIPLLTGIPVFTLDFSGFLRIREDSCARQIICRLSSADKPLPACSPPSKLTVDLPSEVLLSLL